MFAILAFAVATPVAPADISTYFPALSDAVHRCDYGERHVDVPLVDKGQLAFMARALQIADEPPLFRQRLPHGKGPFQTLRFTWIRTFDAPIIIRISMKKDGTGTLIAKRFSGLGGYEPGSVRDRLERTLSREETGRLHALYDPAAFPEPAIPFCGPPPLDGAQWLLEGVDGGGHYRFARLWSPRGGRFRQLALAMVALAGWQAEKIY